MTHTEDLDVEIPDYCGVTEDEIEERKPRVVEMLDRAHAVRAVDGGYRFTLPGDQETLNLVATFVANERACCPIADFEIACSGTEDPIELQMVGPGELKQDLREGLELERFFDDVDRHEPSA